MPRGEKSKYTDKQERKADHIAEGYEKRGVGKKEAERRAWATVNKDDGGGKRPAARGGAPYRSPGGSQGRSPRRQSCGVEAGRRRSARPRRRRRPASAAVIERLEREASHVRQNTLNRHFPNKSSPCPALRRR